MYFDNDKQEYKERTVINGDIAIKPYYYMRNGLLHARFTVDRAVELSDNEERTIKEELSKNPSDKQSIFSKHWNLLTMFVGKTIMHDGIKAGEERMKEMSKYVQQNKGSNI